MDNKKAAEAAYKSMLLLLLFQLDGCTKHRIRDEE